MAYLNGCPPDFPHGVYDTLAAAVRALEHACEPFAVGGAVAMYAGGYARTTSDVDIFVLGDLREQARKDQQYGTVGAILRALQRAGFAVRKVDDSQYHAQLPRWSGTKIRLDILVAWSVPETLAIQRPTLRRIGSVDFPAFSLGEITASKITVDPESDVWFKSKQDIGAMVRAGLVDLEAVREYMLAEEIPYVEELDAIAEELGVGPRRNPAGFRR